MMDLGERKRRILQAIIDDYISSAEPIGSRSIAKKHELGLSSATIRNEMADLEELGYLEQPHTSAGRVPSDLGYRLYVDQLMNRYRLTVAEVQTMQQAMALKMQELDRLIVHTSSIISRLTQYTTVVLPPEVKKDSVKHMQLVPIDANSILLVLVTNAGSVRNSTIRTSKGLSLDLANRLSALLNSKLSGLTVEEINLPKIAELQKEMGPNQEILTPILNHISESISNMEDAELYLGGTTNILNFPEYNDIDKAKSLLNFLEEKKSLHKMLTGMQKNSQSPGKISILIGKENEYPEMQDCSIILSTYTIENKAVGTIGVIGPTRMDYAKVVSSLDYMTNTLNQIIMKLFHDD